MASHNARDTDRREVHVLKQLQHLSAWQGAVVHQILATDFVAALQIGRAIDWSRLIENAQALARRQFAFSAAGRYRQQGLTKTAAGDDFCALFEHEYGIALPPDALPSALDAIAGCLRFLAGQADFLSLLRAGSRHASEQHLHFEVAGATVAAMPDLVFTQPGGKLVIVDWKTGASDTSDYTRQLLIYALAVTRGGRWAGVPPENISLYEVNLTKGQIHQHPVDEQRLLDTDDFIYRSLFEREALVGDGHFADLDFTVLDVADEPATCAHCNFRPLCIGRLVSNPTSPAATGTDGPR